MVRGLECGDDPRYIDNGAPMVFSESSSKQEGSIMTHEEALLRAYRAVLAFSQGTYRHLLANPTIPDFARDEIKLELQGTNLELQSLDK